MHPTVFFSFFFFNDTATTEIYTLSLHDALPIYQPTIRGIDGILNQCARGTLDHRVEHHQIEENAVVDGSTEAIQNGEVEPARRAIQERNAELGAPIVRDVVERYEQEMLNLRVAAIGVCVTQESDPRDAAADEDRRS